MRASEIIRKIADVLDAQETNQSSTTAITNRPDQSDIPTGVEKRRVPRGMTAVRSLEVISCIRRHTQTLR